jgi:hypothetical protein
LLGCGGDSASDLDTDEAQTDTDDSGPMSSGTGGGATSASTNSSTTAGAGTTAGGTTGDPSTSGDVDPEGFDDEFDDPSTLTNWQRLHELEGDGPPYELLDIDETTAEQLTVIPFAGGWYADFDGTFLFKMMSGDFVVETSVAANRRGQDGGPPERLYNSAGLMARDPSSTDGRENWVIHNVGRQSMEVGVATEGKTTVDSQSTLMLTPGTWSGRLRLCRVGDRFVLARRLSDETEWTQTQAYERPDMPDQIQLGMMVNGWNSNGGSPDFDLDPDVVATFDYIRLWRPDAGEASCTAE